MRAIVYMSSDRTDTDITAKLVDIYPDGRYMLINDGILMARHRIGLDREDLITPNEIYDLNIDLNYTAYTVVPGHRLGLAISSSNYPRFRANPNTGETPFLETDMLEATNTIYFGGTNASVVILPIRKTGFTPTSVSSDEKIQNMFHFPNPFSDYTTISYILEEPSHVRLIVFDAFGNQVAELVNEVIKAGNHQSRFNVVGLPQGMYYYTLQINNSTYTNKMILIK
jgi:hypothetical protein